MFFRLAYSRSFAMDGNFSAIHQYRADAADDVNLTNGEFFMTEKTRYQAHVSTAKDSDQVSLQVLWWESCDHIVHYRLQAPTCNEHGSVNNRFRIHKGKDVTGIGATACARHGCYCPGSVVNFSKGERLE